MFWEGGGQKFFIKSFISSLLVRTRALLLLGRSQTSVGEHFRSHRKRDPAQHPVLKEASESMLFPEF